VWFKRLKLEGGISVYWFLIILLLIPQIIRAECAWVLWLNQSFAEEKDVQIIQAGATLKECQEELEKNFKRFMKTYENTPLEYKIHEKNSGKFAYFDYSNQSKGPRYITRQLLCLPDTVNPRPR